MLSNYLIYKFTSPSGKSYIGQTNNFERRIKRHQSRKECINFYNAIQKYGFENFISEILEEGLTLEEANECEEFMIKEHMTQSPNGYNLKSGGLNHKPAEETLEKMRKNSAKRGKPAWNRGLPGINLGITQSPEWVEKRAAANRGKAKPPISEETRQKLGRQRIKPIKVDGVIYESSKLASATLGIPKETLYNRLNKDSFSTYIRLHAQEV